MRSKSNYLKSILALSTCSALLFATALAESSVAVRLVSPTGSSITGVRVEIINLATGETENGVTDAQGRIRFGLLTSGSRYAVRTFETDDYAAGASVEFSLRSDFETGVTVELQPKAETILIVGNRTISNLNTTNAEISATLSSEEISLLPVEARSLERLLFRLPSVTQSTGFFPEAPAVAINGANALFTNYTIDGLDNNENFLGGQRFPVPIGAVQDVTVLASTYSVEYGRTANGVVNVTTPSGGNEFSGDLYYVTRPSDFLQSDPSSTRTSLFGAPVSDSFSRQQAGFSLSGPLAKDKTFFFVNAEFIKDQTDNVLSAPTFNVNDVLQGSNQQLLLTGRLDHIWNEQWKSTLRFNYGDVELERQGGGLSGGVTFPSAGSVQDRRSTNLALINLWQGERFDYEGAFQFSTFDWDYGAPRVAAGPQVTLFRELPGGGADTSQTLAVIGHPGFVFNESETTFQTRHKITWQNGRHKWKIGAEYLHEKFELFGGGNVNGNFSVALSDIQIANLQNVGSGFSVNDLPSDLNILGGTIEIQPNAFGETQQLYAAYIEDQIQASDQLSLTFGLRYDYDSLTGLVGDGDSDNFAPRFGFNYTPRSTIAIRGGVGLYIEKIPYAIISDAIQQNATTPVFQSQLQDLIDQGILPATTNINEITTDRGNAGVSVIGNCATIFTCADTATLQAQRDNLSFTERRIFNPNGLENPQAWQASLGFEWQFRPDIYLGVDAQYSKGENLVRLVDLNAPEPFIFDEAAFLAGADPMSLVRSVSEADATRPTLPVGGTRSIIVSDTGGSSEYRALIFKAQKKRGDDFYDASVFYTLSRLENDTDDINFRANDANNFAKDYGPSLNDRTHVISTLLNFYPWQNFTLSIASLTQSGQPINFVPDAAVFGTTDINGDGLSFADQFTGNPDRYPLAERNSGRLPWATTIDIGAAYRFDGIADGALEMRADFFNIFDTETETGFPVNFTASNQVQIFGQDRVTRSVGQPRTFQFSVSYKF